MADTMNEADDCLPRVDFENNDIQVTNEKEKDFCRNIKICTENVMEKQLDSLKDSEVVIEDEEKKEDKTEENEKCLADTQEQNGADEILTTGLANDQNGESEGENELHGETCASYDMSGQFDKDVNKGCNGEDESVSIENIGSTSEHDEHKQVKESDEACNANIELQEKQNTDTCSDMSLNMAKSSKVMDTDTQIADSTKQIKDPKSLENPNNEIDDRILKLEDKSEEKTKHCRLLKDSNIDVNRKESLTFAEKSFEEAMSSLNEYSDMDNYVELELDSSNSSMDGSANSAMFWRNGLALNAADLAARRDLDPFYFELVLEGSPRLLELIDTTSLDLDSMHSHSPFPSSELTYTSCEICYDDKYLRKRLCCDLPVCDGCLTSYLVSQINVGTVRLRCPSSECNVYIHRDEIIYRLPTESKNKFYKFLVDANNDPNIKTCPRCSYIHKLEPHEIQKFNLKISRKQKKKKKKKSDKNIIEIDSSVTCPDCQLKWCFPCHAPWHENVTCKEFIRGDKLLKSWAQGFKHPYQINAQKCPHCKVYIEKKGGCDHMTCVHCGTSFCYRCGERYIRVKFLGNHSSRLSPFGCKYNFMPDNPGARRAIRSSILGAKLLGGVVLSGLVVAVGALLVGTSFITLPAYFGYKYHRVRQNRKSIKRFRKMSRDMQILREQIRVAESKNGVLGNGDIGVVPPLDMLTLDSLTSSLDSTSTDDSNSISEEDVVAIGIQGEGSQKVEVLVHAQDQQGQTEETQSKTQAKTESKGQSYSDEGQSRGQVKAEVKDQIQVTSESSGKLHVTTIEVDKDESGSEYPAVVVHVKTTNKGESKQLVDQSQSSRESGEETPETDGEHSQLSPPDGNKIGGDKERQKTESYTNELELEKKEKHKKENKIGDLEDTSFVVEEGNSETKGCFVRIFGKKLPVVWEKDKEGGDKIIEKEGKQLKDGGPASEKISVVDGSVKRKKSMKSIKNQPDIVNCALMAEHKHRLIALGKDRLLDDDNLSHGLSHDLPHDMSCDKEDQKDPYYGLISKDNYETPL